MADKSPCVIVDLDSTLCDANHRLHYMTGEKKDWKSFNDGAIHDKPNEWCLRIVQGLLADKENRHGRMEIIFLTGRPDTYTEPTIAWLNRYLPTDRKMPVIMRKVGDYRPAAEFKKDMYFKYIEPEFDVVFALDDDERVVSMWRELGITCLAHVGA